MKHIPEKLLHVIWKNQLYDPENLQTTHGEKLEVIHPGESHADAGPDFFNARIRINDTSWAGNVEIHVNASDWIRHGHQNDRAYDNVILHVVRYNDCEITDRHDSVIPVLVLPCPDKLLNSYRQLVSSEKWISCEDRIGSLEPVYLHQWLSALTTERLHDKYLRMKSVLNRTQNDWEQMLFIFLASCFGIPLNQLPFEMLAGALDIREVMRIRENLFRTEALLFGTAGFLTANLPSDYYTESLLKEYGTLKTTRKTDEVPFHLWKFLRLRPGAFPSVRLALLASLIHLKFPLADATGQIRSKNDLYDLLRVRAGDYWNTHYVPGKISPPRIKYTGNTFIDILIINAIVPYLFTLGKMRNLPEKTELAIYILEEVKKENNDIIKKWSEFGINAENAFESQALIQLYQNYCSQKRCLDCQIGIRLISFRKDL
ncbi:MAG: DUF2851 family protein [Bacteroidales bacterium]|nr:DUF2851 family protein [Bacteroidales bacterium]MBN2697716.1 DUF2851 family protein [Bacteroidales bacterium]